MGFLLGIRGVGGGSVKTFLLVTIFCWRFVCHLEDMKEKLGGPFKKINVFYTPI